MHLSLAHQVPGTVSTHFTDAGTLVLVEVDAESTGDRLRMERARGAAPFPHLYREVRPDEILRHWDLEAGAPPPNLGRDDADDSPAGRP